jgi:SAM-dependent methyltransferase
MTADITRPSRVQRARFSFAILGPRRGVWELLTARRPYDPAADHGFDRAHGTDTAGQVQPADLGIDDADTRSKAILYLPSPPRVTGWMLDQLPAPLDGTTFVDLGCGKGRVALLAAERPFQRVMGVEISAELAAIARRNVGAYRPQSALRCPVDIVQADATTVDLPDTDLVIHLYHPFDTPITAAVLRRLEASLAVTPRRVTVVYLAYTAAVGPVATMFAEFPWLRRTRYEESLRGNYNWLVYTN